MTPSHYTVSLHIDRVFDQPENPESVGDPVELARFDTENEACSFVAQFFS